MGHQKAQATCMLCASIERPCTLPNPRPSPYLNELLGGGKAAHTERHEDPAPGIAALGWVVCELLTDLAVNLVPKGDNTSE